MGTAAARKRAVSARRYRSYAETLTGRVNTVNGRTYARDPTIFAWDLLNEARCQGCAPYTISVRGLVLGSAVHPWCLLHGSNREGMQQCHAFRGRAPLQHARRCCQFSSTEWFRWLAARLAGPSDCCSATVYHEMIWRHAQARMFSGLNMPFQAAASSAVDVFTCFRGHLKRLNCPHELVSMI